MKLKLDEKNFGHMIFGLLNSEYMVIKPDGVKDYFEIRPMFDYHKEGVLVKIILEEYAINVELDEKKNSVSQNHLFNILKNYTTI